MSPPSDGSSRVIPAQLSFLAIFNPSLGNTDESVHKQILFYSSKESRRRARHKSKDESNETTAGEGGEEGEEEEEENEKLRQVGLAQGMVDFVKNFSDGAPVDYIETEKSRILVHELEPGWWILASIDLTRLPSARSATSSGDQTQPGVEYSSREIAPTHLLLQQLLQAHSIFLLHHAPSLQELFKRSSRSGFCVLLERFWTRVIKDWDVLLHGNPAVDIYNGVKLASGGELGVGVGEEEWGSGEREVLEDLVNRTEGLVDLIVSRYGDVSSAESSTGADNSSAERGSSESEAWLGTDSDPRSSDGIVFSGVGSTSRRSLATISQWMDAIFKHGEDAYGVSENPSSRPRRGRRKVSSKQDTGNLRPTEELNSRAKTPLGRSTDLRKIAIENNAAPPGIPPPIVAAVERSLEEATAKTNREEEHGNPGQDKGQGESIFGSDKMIKYLSLGYGTSWTLSPKGLASNKEGTSQTSGSTRDGSQERTLQGSKNSSPAEGLRDESLQEVEPTADKSDEEATEPFVQHLKHSVGKFLIGLSGDLEKAEFDEGNGVPWDDKTHTTVQAHRRIFLRTLTVELFKPQTTSHNGRSPSIVTRYSGSDDPHTSASASAEGSHPIIHHKKLQVAVYVRRPFMFLFLFELHTSNLTMPSFYRNLHHQLEPLQKSLLESTDPAKVIERIADIMGDRSTTTTPVKGDGPGQTIYDIIYDPVKLTVRTSIPNIPLPGSLAAEGLSAQTSSRTVSGSWYTLGIPISGGKTTPPRQTGSALVSSAWTRIEALNVHAQILNSWIATRTGLELERTVKTSRGWWVLWMQVPVQYGRPREAFLVRKAVDHKGGSGGVSRDNSSGKWLLREQTRDASGSSGRSETSAPTTAAGVSEGVGIDARKWIDGLMSFV